MRKRCVEESLVLPVRFLVDRGLAVGRVRRGRLALASETGRRRTVAGRFDARREGAYRLHLCYTMGVPVELEIELEATACHFGGLRWWFRCPHSVTGGAWVCRRRCSKLYLPPLAERFACRACHDLTYKSAQQAHRDEREGAQMFRIRDETEALEDKRRRLEEEEAHT